MSDLTRSLFKVLLAAGAILSIPNLTYAARGMKATGSGKILPIESSVVPDEFYSHDGKIFACRGKLLNKEHDYNTKPIALSTLKLRACSQVSNSQTAAVYTVKSPDENKNGTGLSSTHNIYLYEKGGKCASPLSQAYGITSPFGGESAFFVFKIMKKSDSLRLSSDCDWSPENRKSLKVNISEQTIPFAADYSDHSILVIRMNLGYRFVDTASFDVSKISKIGDFYFVPKYIVDDILKNSKGQYFIAYDILYRRLRDEN